MTKRFGPRNVHFDDSFKNMLSPEIHWAAPSIMVIEYRYGETYFHVMVRKCFDEEINRQHVEKFGKPFSKSLVKERNGIRKRVFKKEMKVPKYQCPVELTQAKLDAMLEEGGYNEMLDYYLEQPYLHVRAVIAQLKLNGQDPTGFRIK